MKRVLVTGGAGFIGSHTVDLLLANNLQVTVLDNLFSGKLQYLNSDHPNLKFVHNDVLNYDALQDEVSQCEAVLHLAALSSVPKSVEDPIQSLKVNTLGLIHVLQAIRASNRSIRLVYASSAAVYGHVTVLPCSDEDRLSEAGLSPYALQKADNERYADLYYRLFGIQSLGLRYFNVYGKRQDPHSPYSGVITKFMDCFENKKPIMIYGDGQQSRDFIHVADIARANLAALRSDYNGVMNVGTGKPESLLNLIRYMEKAFGFAVVKQFFPVRAGDIPASYAKIDKAKNYLDFEAEVRLEQGMESLISNPVSPIG